MRRRSRHIYWALLAIAVLAVTYWLDYRSGVFGPDTPEAVATITGQAEVIDGDSLRVAGHEIRLQGIDAFEYRQTCGAFRCGADASLHMKRLTRGQTVTCEDKGRDRYQRVLAFCHTPAGDLGQAMVEAGLAVPYYDHTNRYAASQRVAKHEERGAWAHSFEAPSVYRRQTQ